MRFWEGSVKVDESGLVDLCAVSDVTPDVPAKSQIAGEDVAVFLVAGRFYVTQDICTHGPGYLSEGYIEGDEVECPFHQGRFCITTGAPTAAPCNEPLKTWPAEVADGRVYAVVP